MRTTRWLGWRGTVVAGLLLLAGLLQACTSNDTNSGPSFPSTVAGSGQPFAIILTSSVGSVKCNGTVTVTAKVLNSTGQSIAEVTIIFKTDKGSVSPTSTVTNSTGEASTTFTATAPTACGTTATITAATVGAAAGTPATATIVITVES